MKLTLLSEAAEALVRDILDKGILIKENLMGMSSKTGDKARAVVDNTRNETNDHGVSLEAIATFVDRLELKYKISKDEVLARLNTTLTPKKLQNLMYFQAKGHALDVTGIDESTGELEFNTCSIESPQHVSRSYFESKSLAIENGATLMTGDKYEWFKTQGTILDSSTWSWLDSPDAGTPNEPGRALIGHDGRANVTDCPGFPNFNGTFRVSLKV